MTARRALLTVLAALVLLGVIGAGAIEIARRGRPEIAWRIDVLEAKVRGDLPALPWRNLLVWLKPGSSVYLAALADDPNPHASIHNGLMQAEHVRHGQEVFLRTCAPCHGSDARGNSGPSLIDAVSMRSDWTFFSTAKWGRAGTPMAAQPLDDTAIWEAHAYVRSLALAADSEHQGASSGARPPVDVTGDEILAADKAPEQWLTYAGNYLGHRHALLAQIGKENVSQLRIAWIAQLRQADREMQVSPLVADGVMYVTESGESVVALDAASGNVLWSYRREVPTNLSLCCGTINRGVAILGKTVFFASIDAHLIALDANTGKQRWDIQVADYRDGYSMTSAPLALPDRIVVGVAGGEFGARGFLAAFDPDQGRLLWKFHAVPEPGEPGHETWGGDSWKTGGAPTPTTGAYDAERDLLIWGTGNPSPSFQAKVRPGDNLYSNSVVAVDAKNGKLKWYYQFTPHDEHDWDSNQQPVLADIPWQGRLRPVVLWANRNGFFYVLDRTNGQFLLGKPFAKQNWNDGFDEKGRPRTLASGRPSAKGSVVWPAIMSASNWWPPSYDASRKLMFVPTSDAAGVFFQTEGASYERGARFEGGAATQYSPNLPSSANVKAIDPLTGRIVWRTVLGTGSDTFVWTVGGVLSTDSGLAFVGYRDTFYALDSDTGKELWRIKLGARVRGSPISYLLNGQQQVAVAAGNTVFTFALQPAR
ncbi:MAG TPA: PQQ-dependent dehydrogenase, methanol/ethanol family [Burkholderiaceae bacterium]|nr:PQQ-dependent dehydrogenase, methanol/ethanol family [Burkholderiaceae bacterium]